MRAHTPLTPAKRQQLTEHPRPGGSPGLGTSGPVGFSFSPGHHGLTPAQCLQATQALRRLERIRPIQERGPRGNALRALRIAGIVSSVKGGRVQNGRWGRRMLATKGGNTMRDHALAHLRAWSPIASLAAMVARECRQAQVYYEEHGTVLPLGAPPKETPEQARVRSLQDAWEQSQWEMQRDFLSW